MKKLMIFFISAILLINLGGAVEESIPTQAVNTCVVLEQECSACNFITLKNVKLPNGTIDYINENMTSAGFGTFYYDCYNVTLNGEHIVKTLIVGTNFTLEAPYNFYVTPNGEESDVAKGLLYLGLFSVLILFLSLSIYGIVKVENMYGRFALFWVAWIFLIAVSFIAWNLSSDFLTSAPFVVSMFKIVFYFVMIASFPLMLGSIAWVVYIHTVTDEMKAMMERGMSPEEAWSRKRGRRYG